MTIPRVRVSYRFLKQLMLQDDLDHYDVMFDNCHHATQRAWNEVAWRPGGASTVSSPIPEYQVRRRL